MQTLYCQTTEYREAISPITGRCLRVNFSSELVFVPKDIDLEKVRSLGAELPVFWKERPDKCPASIELRDAMVAFAQVATLKSCLNAIDNLFDIARNCKYKREQTSHVLSWLTRLWSHGLVAIPLRWTQWTHSINCPVDEDTIGIHLEWFQVIEAVAAPRSERVRKRIQGLVLRLASATQGIAELGDLTPETANLDIFKTLKTHRKAIAKALLLAQVTRYGALVNTRLEDWGVRMYRPRHKYDHQYRWAVEDDPDLEVWRDYLSAWTNHRRAQGPAIRTSEFILSYLIAHPHITRDPGQYCRRDYVPNVAFQEWNQERNKNSRGLYDVNNLASEFFDWLLDTHLSIPDDFGRPVRSTQHWNPISRLLKRAHPVQTHRESIPTRYIRELIRILTEDDLAWPKAMKSDWCTWFNKETGKWEKIWSPVRMCAVLLKLYLPLRTFQVRMLDSGEADSERYHDGAWIENTHPLAADKPTCKGFLRRYSDRLSGRTYTGFFVNTNKTQDRGRDEDDKGYEIPWQHEEVIRIVTFLRDWQERYNPIERPLAWVDLHDVNVVRHSKENDLLKRGATCFLMRDPCGTYRNEPVTDSRLRPYWVALMDELERRIAARGETLPDSSPIRFIARRDPKRGTPLLSVYDLHTLRVSLITALATEGGVPISILSKCVAGHASVLMTLYYVKLDVPYVTRELAEAQKKIFVEEQRNFCRFLQTAEYKELHSLVVSNDATGLTALHETAPGSWVMGDKGICPVGGALCNKGGPKMTSNVQLADYAPAPGGYRNCVRCRFLVTGPAFLGGLVAHFNAIGVKLMEASERYRAKEEAICRLEDELASSENLPYPKMAELNAAYDRQEHDMLEVDELAHNWHATYALIERCRALIAAKGSTASSELSLVLAGTRGDLEIAIEMTSNFELLNAVCQVASVYPGEDITLAALRRSRVLDAMLSRNGRHPIFASLSEQEALGGG